MVEGVFILPRSHDANMALEHRNDNTNWRAIAKTTNEVGRTNPFYDKPADATAIYQTKTPGLGLCKLTKS